jgi:hypothetical protein
MPRSGLTKRSRKLKTDFSDEFLSLHSNNNKHDDDDTSPGTTALYGIGVVTVSAYTPAVATSKFPLLVIFGGIDNYTDLIIQIYLFMYLFIHQ